MLQYCKDTSVVHNLFMCFTMQSTLCTVLCAILRLRLEEVSLKKKIIAFYIFFSKTCSSNATDGERWCHRTRWVVVINQIDTLDTLV